MTRFGSFALAAALALAVPVASNAQTAVGGAVSNFKDTSMLKLPAGQRAAIYDFEDLECPACARAFPITHAAIDRYKIPLIRHDFIIPSHTWSRQAAITARYLQDKVSPDVAEQFRRDTFAAQMSIAGPEDMQNFTRKWFATHKIPQPFEMDPSGRFAAEVQADCTLGDRLGLHETPTIIVLAPHGWIQVKDVTQLYSAIDMALAQSPAPKPAAAHKATHQK
jgi:protein-disulfide isomerase